MSSLIKQFLGKSRIGLLAVLLATINIFAVGTATAAGLLSPADGTTPALDIREHHVNVVLEDGYATTQVDQVFHNPHNKDLEAIYSFPVPEKGAVSQFTMWIDGKAVHGEVLEKKQARQVYEEEKAAGNDVGLTEQDGYKTFEIRVSPVRAGQDTRIRLVYLQPVHMDTGIGRYVYPLEDGGVDEQKKAFWTASEAVKEKFSFDLKLRSGYPVEALRTPNQPSAQISKLDDKQWLLKMTNSAAAVQTSNDDGSAPQATTNAANHNQPAFTLDKDIVVYWRHADGLPGSIDLVTYKPDANKRGTFMMTITPADDLKPITEGRDWAFVLDISGSMSGGKWSSLTDGVVQALKAMKPEDRFRIILFNSSARELTNGFVNATPEKIRSYSEQISQMRPHDGTNLYAGLKKGMKSLDADRTTSIILVTDGVANVGETEQKKFLELVRQKDVRLFSFIMGNSANRPLLEVITRESGGFYATISNSDDIAGQLMLAASKVSHQAFHDVKVKISGVKTSDMSPENIGTIYRGQQIILFGHYRKDGDALVEVSSKISGTDHRYKASFKFPKVSTLNPEIERLWAFSSIEEMLQKMEDFGEDADSKQAVTDLAKAYSLVTDYTSMIVLREDVFAKRGIERNNAKRIAIEQVAQQQRAEAPLVKHTIDPGVQPKRASTHHMSFGGGGGAFTPVWLLLFAPMLWFRKNRKNIK